MFLFLNGPSYFNRENAFRLCKFVSHSNVSIGNGHSNSKTDCAFEECAIRNCFNEQLQNWYVVRIYIERSVLCLSADIVYNQALRATLKLKLKAE